MAQLLSLQLEVAWLGLRLPRSLGRQLRAESDSVAPEWRHRWGEWDPQEGTSAGRTMRPAQVKQESPVKDDPKGNSDPTPEKEASEGRVHGAL